MPRHAEWVEDNHPLSHAPATLRRDDGVFPFGVETDQGAGVIVQIGLNEADAFARARRGEDHDVTVAGKAKEIAVALLAQDDSDLRIEAGRVRFIRVHPVRGAVHGRCLQHHPVRWRGGRHVVVDGHASSLILVAAPRRASAGGGVREGRSPSRK